MNVVSPRSFAGDDSAGRKFTAAIGIVGMPDHGSLRGERVSVCKRRDAVEALTLKGTLVRECAANKGERR